MHVATTLNPNNPAWICPQAVVLAVRVSEAMAVRYGPASRWVTHSRIQASLIREEAGDKVRPGPSPSAFLYGWNSGADLGTDILHGHTVCSIARAILVVTSEYR